MYFLILFINLINFFIFKNEYFIFYPNIQLFIFKDICKIYLLHLFYLIHINSFYNY